LVALARNQRIFRLSKPPSISSSSTSRLRRRSALPSRRRAARPHRRGDRVTIGRREFILLFFGGAAACPIAARAQQAQRMRRIGMLLASAESDPEGRPRIAEFLNQLQGLGWTDGRNIRIDYRWASGEVDRLRMFAKESSAKTPAVYPRSGTRPPPYRSCSSRPPIRSATVSSPAFRGPAATSPVLPGRSQA
jgi:putative tryptophan/tyrosine transport system substrate-binding protein